MSEPPVDLAATSRAFPFPVTVIDPHVLRHALNLPLRTRELSVLRFRLHRCGLLLALFFGLGQVACGDALLRSRRPGIS